MASVDEGKVDRRQAARVVVGKKLRACALVVSHDALDAEAPEMRAHLVRVVPLRCTAQGAQRPMLEDRVRRIDEAKGATPVVLEAQSKADDTEAEARADDDDVLRTQCAYKTVIDEPETYVQRVAILVMTEGPSML